MSLEEQLKQDAGAGFETLEGQDFSAPFLILTQPNSTYLNEQHPNYVPDARPGRILNTASGKCYKECHVVPVRYQFRNVEWKPRNSGGGFVASYDRKDTPNDLRVLDAVKGTVGRANGNSVQQTGYYLCMLEEENWDRVILGMTSTQLKVSKKWNSIMMAKTVVVDGKEYPLAMYANVYTLSVVQLSNSQGSWYGWKIDFNRQLTDIQLYNQAKEAHQIENFLPERLLLTAIDNSDIDAAMPPNKEEKI